MGVSVVHVAHSLGAYGEPVDEADGARLTEGGGVLDIRGQF